MLNVYYKYLSIIVHFRIFEITIIYNISIYYFILKESKKHIFKYNN